MDGEGGGGCDLMSVFGVCVRVGVMMLCNALEAFTI